MTELESLIREIRASFRALANYGTALHADIGVNASMRAVMEYVSEKGPTSVPEIARAKTVSRQHIQTIVNQLFDGGFAETRANPNHKRSPLIALTAKGARAFKEMQAREKDALRAVSRFAPAADLKAARATLAALREKITAEIEREGENHDPSS